MLSGQVTKANAVGAEETVRANDLFYWPSAHDVRADKDAELIMFRPQKEHSHVNDRMIDMTMG